MYLFPSQKVLYFSDFLFLFNKPEIDTIFVTEHVIKENIYIYIYIHTRISPIYSYKFIHVTYYSTFVMETK